jgi:hypothetical protein
MGHPIPFVAELKPLNGRCCQIRGLVLEHAHARSRVRKLSAPIELIGIDRACFRMRRWP